MAQLRKKKERIDYSFGSEGFEGVENWGTKLASQFA
jgi:hypothetical protein